MTTASAFVAVALPHHFRGGLLPNNRVLLAAAAAAHNQDLPHPTRRQALLAAATVLLTSTLLPSSSQQQASSSAGMSCVVSHCTSPLFTCLTQPKCAQGLSCFIQCAADGENHDSEGARQVQCMNRFGSSQLDQFTACTLRDFHCYLPLAPDPKYPALDSNALWDRQLQHADLSSFLQGTWYVSAGLNPLFDCFDCQVHDFIPVGTDVDAIFSYRVRDGRQPNYIPKQERKHLAWQTIPPDDGMVVPRNLHHQRWGRDAWDILPKQFSSNSTPPTTTKTTRRLVLTTVPDVMDYQDVWIVLSASPPSTIMDDNAYMVVAYRGSNAAWQGYGGLNVYTRKPVNIQDLSNDDRNGIEKGLRKVGLTLKDLIPVNNSCL